ncbi:XRN 5'-3' exonuclease N-terminus-domain-containing protein [Phakopsora pachyrhizi]|uniref:XRN 5'-3' exonuclease N-terminus-domain-containing protein n=1 Tax=Phakopsora pachyrhizi TaxID=170000 RepID=A0AAV0AMN0_PHAPC|nr:XRN 5'-3' exonuclease N-terminus-domain-containing protein [Phakopsora pachyrhizi]
MGVPALLRWLSRKYPRIVEQAVEDEPIGSQVEGDSLYLDMNGIIHCCTHPKGKIPPETEQEMIIKINQQQSCWLRAAQEANSKQLENLSVIQYSNNRIWDSNAITPGTSFMKLLTGSLRYWNVHKLNIDLGWKQIQVILSDASVPGEGEHKIMKFICRSKTQPSYNCNTRHVIYGLDTDLIMLSLENHEPHFKVLREDFFSDERRRKGCHLCRHPGHHSSQCQGKPKERVNEPTSSSPDRSPIQSANLDAAAMLKAELIQKAESATPAKSHVKSGTNFERKVDNLEVDPSPELMEVPDNNVAVLSDDDDPGNISVIVQQQPSKPDL